MMSDPFYQAYMQMLASNPEMMRQALQSNPLYTSNPALRASMDSMLQNPQLLQSMMSPQALQQQLQQLQQLQSAGIVNPFAGLMAQPAAPSASPFTSPVMTGPLQSVSATERFATQLQQMKDMGFYDEAANIQALTATGGNVSLAIERLLQQMSAFS